jgi:hypothetical protein
LFEVSIAKSPQWNNSIRTYHATFTGCFEANPHISTHWS